MSIARWLRVGAAVAAVAAVNFGSPQAAHAATTPCTQPEGVVVHGRAATQYVLLRYDNLGPGGLKVCVQQGGITGEPGYYGVLDIPLPGASAGMPSSDDQGGACMAQGGEVVNSTNTLAGRVRLSYLNSVQTSRISVCLEAPGISRRLIVPVPMVSAVAPTFERLYPAPYDGRLFLPWPAMPSGTCGGLNLLDLTLATGDRVRLYTHATDSGKVNVCFRHQDASGEGVGGKLSVDATALPRIDTAEDATGCTFLILHQESPGDVRVDTSAPGQSGPVSVCVSTSPTDVLRVTVTPAVAGLVGFTPDPS